MRVREAVLLEGQSVMASVMIWEMAPVGPSLQTKRELEARDPITTPRQPVTAHRGVLIDSGEKKRNLRFDSTPGSGKVTALQSISIPQRSRVR